MVSSSEQSSLTSVELADEGPSWRVLLHEGDDVLEAEVVLGAWTVTDALAVTAGGEQIGEIQPLSENSRWVYIKDSEGNIIGLYDEVSAA